MDQVKEQSGQNQFFEKWRDIPHEGCQPNLQNWLNAIRALYTKTGIIWQPSTNIDNTSKRTTPSPIEYGFKQEQAHAIAQVQTV